MGPSGSQREQTRALLAARGIVRLSELRTAGVTAATIGRMEHDGEVVRLGRGLYQLPDAPIETHHSFAEAAKRLPKGVICLISALTFHDLTDQLPRKVWMAIGKSDWAPTTDQPPIKVVRFTPTFLTESVEIHKIEGVDVKVFGVAKTVADCFRHRGTIGFSVAIEALQQALRRRNPTPGDIARQAEIGGVVTVMRPYLEALTANR